MTKHNFHIMVQLLTLFKATKNAEPSYSPNI
jgi:hypothetical protein